MELKKHRNKVDITAQKNTNLIQEEYPISVPKALDSIMQQM